MIYLFDTEFYYGVSTEPTFAQRKELHSRIIAIPGAEWYTREHLSRWFASKRQRRAKLLNSGGWEVQKDNKARVAEQPPAHETGSITTANICATLFYTVPCRIYSLINVWCSMA
jgi:hypothetical protein